MATKSTRYVDDLGRIVIPSHIRKALNIGNRSPVTVELADDNSIRIRPTKERCAVCGCCVNEKHHAVVKSGTGNRLVCYECAQAIARDMIRQM